MYLKYKFGNCHSAIFILSFSYNINDERKEHFYHYCLLKKKDKSSWKECDSGNCVIGI